VRILFAGTPAIAVPTLVQVARHFEVAAVLTNTDKKGARGRRLVPSPVKEAAQELGIDVIQFNRLGKDAREAVAPYACDTLLCFAYGRIFGPKFLSLFSGEKLNIHPSLLPDLRGPSPIQGAILNQLQRSGISIQRLALEMDSGEVVKTLPFDLTGEETVTTLTERVAQLAAPLAVEALKEIAGGTARFIAQKGEPTYTTLIDPSMAKLDFSLSAKTLHAQIRAMQGWPKAQTQYDGQLLYLTAVYGPLSEAGSDPVETGVAPGTVIARNKQKGVGIATGDGVLWVTGLQLESRKELDALSFLNGNQRFLHSTLG
jgi:methionyl-tRNA formyltransferase